MRVCVCVCVRDEGGVTEIARVVISTHTHNLHALAHTQACIRIHTHLHTHTLTQIAEVQQELVCVCRAVDEACKHSITRLKLELETGVCAYVWCVCVQGTQTQHLTP